jgi:DeoR/GlpR family transcriptional regulator of sugar metabolism
MDADANLSIIERQEEILKLIRKKRRTAVAELAEHFGTSAATVRRDLEKLASDGMIQRFHGGARAIQQAPHELPVLQRAAEQSREKQYIGRAAAGLVEDGDIIFLGSGTTVLEIARNLHDHRDLTVVTNSLSVVNELSSTAEITVIVLGGILRHSEMSMIGQVTEQALKEVRAQKIFMGIHAIDVEAGLTNDYMLETMTDRAILEQGSKVIITADHTKVQRVALAFLAPITSFHTLVTDDGCPPEFIDQLAARGIEVIIA